MIRVLLVLGVLLGSAAIAQAQPSPVKLYVDVVFVNGMAYPAVEGFGPVVPSGAPIVIFGWTFNCYTGQQPPTFDVFLNDDRDPPFVLVPRLERPDVQDAAGAICSSASRSTAPVRLPSGPHLGFAVVIDPLPSGTHNILIRVMDPVAWPTTDSQVGAQYRNVSLIVR